MIKVFRTTKSRRLYIGDETFDRNEGMAVERSGDKFSIKMLYTNRYVIWDFPFYDIDTFHGQSFADADECENYLRSTVLTPNLKIFRFIGEGEDPLTTDFTLFGLGKESPSYDRGRKFLANYLDPVQADIVVSKTFIDAFKTNGRLKALDVRFDFYAEDGTIGLTKTERVKNYNAFEAETELRKRRERQIDFLIAAGQDTPIEPVLNSIFDRYYEEQLHYKQKASSTQLADAINNETDPTFLAYFAIRVPLVSDPTYEVPVKESILYQIGAITEAQLSETLTVAGA